MKVIKLFSSCFLVPGFNRSIIIDHQRLKYYTIPNSMYKMLQNYDGMSISQIKKELCKTKSEELIIDEYLAFLFDREIIFECNENISKQFIKINDKFHHASIITNAILVFDNLDIVNLRNVLNQLISLACFNIELRLNNKISIQDLNSVLYIFNQFEIDNLFLIVDLNENIEEIKKINESYSFITYIINFNQNFIPQIPINGIFYTTKDLSKAFHCGIIQESYFNLNLPHYTESLHHNTCLNRKIAIDAEGNIKNCPSMKESFGNIKDTTLEEAINKPGFKKYWNITKDQITKCKDCEFRHVCTDCRAYTDNPEDMYAAPLKCGYDPYTCTWEEWSTNPLKQKAIDYYGMREIMKNE